MMEVLLAMEPALCSKRVPSCTRVSPVKSFETESATCPAPVLAKLPGPDNRPEYRMLLVELSKVTRPGPGLFVRVASIVVVRLVRAKSVPPDSQRLEVAPTAELGVKRVNASVPPLSSSVAVALVELAAPITFSSDPISTRPPSIRRRPTEPVWLPMVRLADLKVPLETIRVPTPPSPTNVVLVVST